jgi:hypothetical protein
MFKGVIRLEWKKNSYKKVSTYTSQQMQSVEQSIGIRVE